MSFNAIFSRVGHKDSVYLLLSLLATTYVPFLVYGTEAALGKDAKELGRLVYAYNRAWSKIYKTFDKNTLYSCQYFTGCLPLEYQIDLRRIIFLKSLQNYTDKELYNIFALFDQDLNVLFKYNVRLFDSISVIKHKIWEHFSK